ncbi:MAG: hypothetical protein ABI237_08170 [Ginsengibacter sp.]
MKTVIINKTAKNFEVAKQIIYTVQVIALGLFIPFLFVFGITYNPQNDKPVNEPRISVPVSGTPTVSNNTVILDSYLSDQNS